MIPRPSRAVVKGVTTTDQPPTFAPSTIINDLIRLTIPVLSPQHDLAPAVGPDSPGTATAIEVLPVELVPLVLVVAQELGRTLGIDGDPLTLATEMVMAAFPPQGFRYWGVSPGWLDRPEGVTSSGPSGSSDTPSR